MWCLAALTSAFLLQAAPHAAALFLPNPPELQRLLSRHRAAPGQNRTVDATPSRGRLAIRWSDRKEILKLHNKLRGGVYPTASNMEYMVWDDELERSAARWARQCVWDHGPAELLPSIGQNLAVHWGRYRSPAQHVQAWYDEVKDYTYPYRHECRPFCPDRCSGPMCTHYTQLVWATTSRVGCAVHVCPRMDVWREVWENAVYLVCNYSPKGNWIGEAPYKHGQPCSQCPPGYGGGCRVNLCHKDPYCPETEDMNEVEKPQVLVQPAVVILRFPAVEVVPPVFKNCKRNTLRFCYFFAAQNIDCATRMQDRCKGTTCNRYKCPANCQNKRGRVWGTIFYDVQSSICRAALHSGAIDSSGGLVDVTRKAQLPFFVKVTKNGQSLSFSKEQSVDCYTTVAEICLFRKPASTCPRVLCPSNCKNEPSYWAPVTGSRIYSDSSSICRAGIHAGVIKPSGGYVDVVPLEKRERYTGTLKNGIQSESKTNSEGHSFRVFAVRD
uniref:Cysteine-rich secretory protein LCCL domain containing 2 n=1 Tax=Scleropages formosus TaxID=113540 RepID=A0A8C9T020_SCLFO